MLIKSSDFTGGAIDSTNLPNQSRDEFVFVGRSNVGKSSLINTLCSNKRLARISGTPGKTRQINYYLINNKFYFVDLPGYGYARVAAEVRGQLRKLIVGYLEHSPHIKLAIQLVDSRHGIMESDEMMISNFEQHNIPYVVVLTKIDKISRNDLTNQLLAIEKNLHSGSCLKAIIPFSAVTREGRDKLLQAIKHSL
jgi:GTP-binding protein